MTRRAARGAAGAVGIVVATASPAFAHGLGGRVDLPVPRWLFVFGAATAVIASFAALVALWREPRLERPRVRALSPFLQTVLRSRAIDWTVRLLALGVFLVVVGAGVQGPGPDGGNLAPVVVFVWFWVGFAFAHAFLGNLWATVSPFDTVGRLLRFDDEVPVLEYPKAWGRWPAAFGLFGFVWLELVDPFRGSVTALGVAIVVYTLVTLAGMAVFGRRAWVENGEAFAVYFGLLSRISPLGRDGEGRVLVRPPLSGLAGLEPRPGLLALVMVALGSTTFDGFSRSSFWVSRVSGLSEGPRLLASTAALIAAIGVVALTYTLAMAVAAAVAGTERHPLAVRFVHSLVPIVFAYVVAHYFSFLLIEGQLGLSQASDPFGRGWNLFGTAGWTVNLTLVGATLVWYVQVAAIVAGHVGGVMLAHDRAIAAFDRAIAVRTQYALLAVMVLFTAGGLLILSGG
ncbi:MAG: fenitrothion hydrolase [Actinomycetota bacterium]